MAFPTYEGATKTGFASGSSHLVDMPATVNSGDLLLILFSSYRTPADTPSGWTKLASAVNGNADSAAFAKVADGTEGGTTVDVTTGATSRAASAIVPRVSNWEGTLSGVEISGNNQSLNSNPDPPSLTPSWGADDTLWIAWGSAADDDESWTAAPTNYSNLESQITGAGTDASCSTGSATRTINTTTEDPGTFTLSGSEGWIAWTIGVQPAAGGGGSTPAGTYYHRFLGAA